MNKQGTILIVDDNKGVLTAVQLLLKNYFTKVITLASPVTLPAVLREEAPEVVLLDMNFTSGINNGNEVFSGCTKLKNCALLSLSYFSLHMPISILPYGASKRELRILS